MKLLIAIVNDDDSDDLIDTLTEKDFRITKLATSGGFLKAGNTTLMMGVEDTKTEEVISIIKDICKERDEIIPSPIPITESPEIYIQYPIEVKVGGATVFIIDVEQFIKI